jgi:hypothetical protein
MLCNAIKPCDRACSRRLLPPRFHYNSFTLAFSFLRVPHTHWQPAQHILNTTTRRLDSTQGRKAATQSQTRKAQLSSYIMHPTGAFAFGDTCWERGLTPADMGKKSRNQRRDLKFGTEEERCIPLTFSLLLLYLQPPWPYVKPARVCRSDLYGHPFILL